MGTPNESEIFFSIVLTQCASTHSCSGRQADAQPAGMTYGGARVLFSLHHLLLESELPWRMLDQGLDVHSCSALMQAYVQAELQPFAQMHACMISAVLRILASLNCHEPLRSRCMQPGGQII